MTCAASNAVLIIGPGAMGLLCAGRLHRAGIAIGLLDHRPERARQLQHITLREGSTEYTAEVTCRAEPRVVAAYNHILVCVKAYATTKVAETIAPYVKKDARVLSLQNGLGNEAMLLSLPCRNNIRIGITSYGAYLEDEKTVHAAGDGDIQLGGCAADACCTHWKRLFDRAGFQVQIRHDINQMLWMKLILNAAINPVTALFGYHNGELPQQPEAWNLACAILQESVAVANGVGISLDAQYLQNKLLAVCESTRENRSSMLVDLQARKPTEIDAINGAIARAGRQAGVPTPYNDAMLREIRAHK